MKRNKTIIIPKEDIIKVSNKILDRYNIKPLEERHTKRIESKTIQIN